MWGNLQIAKLHDWHHKVVLGNSNIKFCLKSCFYSRPLCVEVNTVSILILRDVKDPGAVPGIVNLGKVRFLTIYCYG